MIQVHYIYRALCFYWYYVVSYNEIIIQLTIMQNQWEAWACFLATRWFHLGGDRRDTDTSSVLLMSSLLHNLAMVAALQKTLLHKDRMLEMEAGVFSAFVTISWYVALTLSQNVWRFEVVSNILLRPLSFVISSRWPSTNMDKVESPGLLINGSWIHPFPVLKRFVVGK